METTIKFAQYMTIVVALHTTEILGLAGLAHGQTFQSITEHRYIFETSIPRIAIIFGNRSYDDKRVSTINNAYNDADGIASRLSSLGFDTIVRYDATFRDLSLELNYLKSNIIRKYSDRPIRPLILIFFSGHGFNTNGRGYLAGADIDPDNPAESSLAVESALGELSRDSILILWIDACRSDAPEDGRKPSNTAFRSSAELPPTWRGQGIGDPSNLYRYKSPFDEDTLISAAKGGQRKYYIGYAAMRVGDAAKQADSEMDENSPYTEGLLKIVGVEGKSIQAEMRRVQDYVYSKTEKLQEPTTEGDPGEIYLLLLPQIRDRQLAEWKQVLETASQDKISWFLNDFPDSPFAEAAATWLFESQLERMSRE